ncbi:MAG: hypothetical protein AAFY20_14815 [Cyanobacteria bacterium J06639_14]
MPIREMDWDANAGQKARIYRNLNNGRMSIQVKTGKSWKVVGHVLEAVLQDVQFRVSEAGRQRVIRDQCKNVHAWGQGLLLGPAEPSIYAPVDLAYNPYVNDSFVQRDSDNIITSCKFLVVRDNRVFVSPDAVGAPTNRPALTVLNGGRQNIGHRQPYSKTLAIAA